MSRDKCPECGSAMEEGFIPDLAHGQIAQLAWHRGAPQPSKFLGLSNGVKLDVKETIKITAHRCTRCGFLKLFAPSPIPASDDRGDY